VSEAVTTLAEAKKLAGHQHILTAARRIVIDVGLDVTMDQIAEATGTSRRTLFRYFTTRERLIAEAFTAGMEDYAKQLPAFDGDRDEWLWQTCLAAHRMNTGSGPGFWALATRNDLPAELAEIEEKRRALQRAAAQSVAQALWRASEREGKPPRALTLCVTSHLCTYFTGAVIAEGGGQWRDAAELAFEAIMEKLRGLLAGDPAASSRGRSR
jgi:AcrR family transcriptional regulator